MQLGAKADQHAALAEHLLTLGLGQAHADSANYEKWRVKLDAGSGGGGGGGGGGSARQLQRHAGAPPASASVAAVRGGSAGTPRVGGGAAKLAPLGHSGRSSSSPGLLADPAQGRTQGRPGGGGAAAHRTRRGVGV